MGSGFRTFASGEVLTSSNVQNYLMDQAVMVFAGTAERGSALPSPEVGMTAYSTATGMQVWDGSAWVAVGGLNYGVATGGAGTSTATIDGINYTILEFQSTGSLVVSTEGLFDIGVICGGGGGRAGFAGFTNLANGGAGGGGWFEETITLSAGTVTVTVGAGGADSTHGGASGVGSRTFNLGGAPVQDGSVNEVRAGVCGCGSTRQNAAGGLSFADFIGRAGGTGPTGNDNLAAGGGGGAGGVGGNGNGATQVGGNGGAGYDVSAFIGGSTRSLGGGGGSCGRTTGGTGSGGGGNGASGSGTGGNGSVNTGGGAGSSIGSSSAATGGSGIVFVRFRS
jgi:hypothetical protein